MEINKPIKKLFDISGRNFVISGSAGMLGKEFSTTMCKAGANVILLDINQKENKKIEKELVKRYNGKTKSYPIDITNKKQIKKLAKNILKEFGQVDGLVNCAAFTTKGSIVSKSMFESLENFPLELWQKSIDINLTGSFLLSQEFGNIMSKQKKGVIVNISSIYGVVGNDQRIYGKGGINAPPSYAVSKAGIINLTRYLAAYWHKKNIRVNTLTLGGVKDESYQTKRFIKNYSEKTMLGRMASKIEYNGALLFLLSDASSYMTGSNLIVDGGWTAW